MDDQDEQADYDDEDEGEESVVPSPEEKTFICPNGHVMFKETTPYGGVCSKCGNLCDGQNY